jgi:hypothetical protein
MLWDKPYKGKSLFKERIMNITLNLNEEQQYALEVLKEMSIDYDNLLKGFIVDLSKEFYEEGIDYDSK